MLLSTVFLWDAVESPVHARAPLRNQGPSWRHFRQSWLPFSVQVLLIFHVVRLNYASRWIFYVGLTLCRSSLFHFLFRIYFSYAAVVTSDIHWFLFMLHLPTYFISCAQFMLLFGIVWTTCNLCANTQWKLKLFKTITAYQLIVDDQ